MFISCEKAHRIYLVFRHRYDSNMWKYKPPRLRLSELNFLLVIKKKSYLQHLLYVFYLQNHSKNKKPNESNQINSKERIITTMHVSNQANIEISEKTNKTNNNNNIISSERKCDHEGWCSSIESTNAETNEGMCITSFLSFRFLFLFLFEGRNSFLPLIRAANKYQDMTNARMFDWLGYGIWDAWDGWKVSDIQSIHWS